MNSHPLLGIDGNSTWRLVLWKQVLTDHFPANLFGLGLGTPIFRYYPVEDYNKLDSLPYILGAHNSYIYLFGRLGIVYLLVLAVLYTHIFKEYFYHKTFYYSNNTILLFWSFYAVSIIALFNPALESPVYAAGYWLVLGLLAKAITNRNHLPVKHTMQS
jgi:O-antigen ligase